MDKKADEQGWGRDQLTLRLTVARLARLRALADHMGPGATPTDTVARAIELASAQLDAPANDARLEAIEDQLGALVAGHKLATDRLEAAVLALARNMAKLHALISEVASQPSDEF